MITMPERSSTSSVSDFERIFREYGPLVYRTAYAVMGNREDADDILQTVFLRLLRREGPPDLGKNPKGYLYRAAVNLSLDTLKIRRRHPQAEVDPERVEAHASAAVLFDDEMHDRLYRAIAKLSPATAELVILRYVHNVSDGEIAKMVGVSRTVIAVRLFRARARLKKLIRSALGEKL